MVPRKESIRRTQKPRAKGKVSLTVRQPAINIYTKDENSFLAEQTQVLFQTCVCSWGEPESTPAGLTASLRLPIAASRHALLIGPHRKDVGHHQDADTPGQRNPDLL